MSVSVGVIGCGYWGLNHIRVLSEIPNADLTWVCDIDRDRLEYVRSRYPQVNVTTDYKELLDSDVAAVVVATPADTHFRIARDCLRAYKHVLVEKPLAMSVRDAEALVRLGERKRRVVMVGHTYQYSPAVLALRDIIMSGELGEIRYITSIRTNMGKIYPNNNVLWELAPHDLSLLYEILGMSATFVSAQGVGGIMPYDFAQLSLRYGDVLAGVWVSWLAPEKVRRMTVVGSRKMLVYDDMAEDKIRIFDVGVELVDNVAHYYDDGVASIPLLRYEPLRAEDEDFIWCVSTGGVPRSSGYVGLEVVRVLEAAQKSLRLGGAAVNICRRRWRGG